jgi:hypothetical protein
MSVDDRLERAIAEMQAPVPVRPAWREALLRDIAATSRLAVSPGPVAHPRMWTMRPALAIAAAAACVVLGVAAGIAVSRNNSPTLAESAPNALTKLTTVRFVIVAPAARQVSLVGDFNQWDVSANPMRPSHDGVRWVLEVPLAPGRHTYAFVVDGDVLRDPTAPTVVDDDFGMPNSIIFVGDGWT